MTLQDMLNFTTMLYTKSRKKMFEINSENGTYENIGIKGDMVWDMVPLRDIFFKTADIAVTPFGMTLDRAIFVDFLPPIKYATFGIYIPTSNTERIYFETYLVPFSLILWITLGLTGVTFTLWRFLLLKVHGSETIFGFDGIWSSFSGFFGGKPTPTQIDKKSSYKIMILSTLFCGTVVWISYRARLNAELAVHEKKYPFDDMDSFSKTNWR